MGGAMVGKGVRYTWTTGLYERKGEEGGSGEKVERGGEENTNGRGGKTGGGGARADLKMRWR